MLMFRDKAEGDELCVRRGVHAWSCEDCRADNSVLYRKTTIWTKRTQSEQGALVSDLYCILECFKLTSCFNEMWRVSATGKEITKLKKREVINYKPTDTSLCSCIRVHLPEALCVCARIVKRKFVCGYNCANFMFLNNVHLNYQNTKPSILYNSDIQSHIYVQTIHFTVFWYLSLFVHTSKHPVSKINKTYSCKNKSRIDMLIEAANARATKTS